MKESTPQKKLYLIRRSNGLLVGPMLEAQVVRAFQDQRFDLRDEISGHCGPWVMFEDREAMTRYYGIIDRYLGGFRQDIEKSKKRRPMTRPFMSRVSEKQPKFTLFAREKSARLRLLGLTLVLVFLGWISVSF